MLIHSKYIWEPKDIFCLPFVCVPKWLWSTKSVHRGVSKLLNFSFQLEHCWLGFGACPSHSPKAMGSICVRPARTATNRKKAPSDVPFVFAVLFCPTKKIQRTAIWQREAYIDLTKPVWTTLQWLHKQVAHSEHTHNTHRANSKVEDNQTQCWNPGLRSLQKTAVLWSTLMCIRHFSDTHTAWGLHPDLRCVVSPEMTQPGYLEFV